MTGGVELEGEPSVVSIEQKAMSNKMTLVVRFLMDEAVKRSSSQSCKPSSRTS
jgi:hypothetical protein